MSFTWRTMTLLALAAITAIWLPLGLSALLMAFIATAAIADALQVRKPPSFTVEAPAILSRGVAASLDVTPVSASPGVLVKQPVATADITLSPSTGTDSLQSVVLADRRGRHVLPPLATKSRGPLGLGVWYHRVGEGNVLTVYPDLPAARRIAMDVRVGRFRGDGRRSRGPLGLGTDLESIREYLPDDDIRQVNWRATARVGSPMSNTYRVEQDRHVVCLIDCGRLMAAPVTTADGGATVTRLDVAVDVVAAITAVATEIGDKVGVVAFDQDIIRIVSPRRDGAATVLDAIHDLEPAAVDADYERAFQHAVGLKRSLVIVLTDLLDETAGKPLVDAIPVLMRKHAVTVVGLSDPYVDQRISTPAETLDEAMETAVALDIQGTKELLTARLRHSGADVVEGSVGSLSVRTVAAYLRAKRQARA